MDPHFQQETHFSAGFVNSNDAIFHSNDNKFSPSVSAGNMVSVTPTARMKTYGMANVPQQTRHARRIYVGGIPPSYIDEDGIRNFINTTISQGLGEENDHSYVLSVYINQKKCFAFVELKSIELAAACLDLDGIIMKNVVLRILRANEYKPELIPQSLNKAIKFDLSHFQFGSITTNAIQASEQDEIFVEKTLDSLVQFTSLNGLEPGSVTVVGFPYDEGVKKSLGRVSTANTPKFFRGLLRKFKYGMVDNPEFDIDISRLKVLDVGDVLTGKVFDETKLNLSTTIAELVARGSVPFVVGGSKDLSYYSGSGLLSLYGSKLVVVYVGARGDVKILEDLRFYGSKVPQNCQGRYLVFAAQGCEFPKDEANYVIDHGGKIVWLTKNLRATGSVSPVESFRELLKDIKKDEFTNLSIMVTLDASALSASTNPHVSNVFSPHGLSLEDFAEIARTAGAEPNVVLVNLTEFAFEAEDITRENFLTLDIFYQFLLGFASRRELLLAKQAMSGQMHFQRNYSPSSNPPTYEKSITGNKSTPVEEVSEIKSLALNRSLMRNHSEFRQASESSINWNSSHSLKSDPLALSSTSSLSYTGSSSHLKSGEFHRGLVKTTSTISTLSSNLAIERYNRSSSSYTFKNSSSFNYPLNPALAVGQRINSSSIPSSGMLTQSMPDIMGELHPFDENLDLVTDTDRLQKSMPNVESLPMNLKVTIAAQSNDTSHTLPYTSVPLNEALVSPSTYVQHGYIFDENILLGNQNLESQDH